MTPLSRLRHFAASTLMLLAPVGLAAAATADPYQIPASALPDPPVVSDAEPCFFEEPCAAVPIWTVSTIVGPPDLPPVEVVRRYKGEPDPGNPAQGLPPRTQIDRDQGAKLKGTPDSWLVFEDRCALLHEFVVGTGWVQRAVWIGEWAAAPVCPAP